MKSGGTILINGTPNAKGELTAVGTGVTVTGYEKVGGIVGINQGSLGTEGDGSKLASDAKQVRATHGYAEGGVVGTTSGNLINAVNRSDRVSADAGTAGGVTALNESGKTISSCINYGNVSSSNGHAGGIVAENNGTVKDRTVEGEDAKGLTIYSRGVDETGAVCAVNTGKITGSKAEKGVELQSSASVFGGVVGTNKAGATVADAKLTYMPTINSNSGKSLTVGGAAGQNDGTIQRITTDGIAFEDFTNYQYLGGIAGTNGLNDVSGTAKAQITDCTFSGTIKEARGAAWGKLLWRYCGYQWSHPAELQCWSDQHEHSGCLHSDQHQVRQSRRKHRQPTQAVSPVKMKKAVRSPAVHWKIMKRVYSVLSTECWVE